MKRILLLVLMLIFFITPSAFAAEGNVYENQQFKFRITVPDDWQINDEGIPIVEIISPEKSSKAGIFVIQNDNKIISDTITPELETKTETDLLKNIRIKVPTATLIYKHHLKISNHDALKFLISYGDTYFVAYIFFKNDYQFAIGTRGFSNNLKKDQEIIDPIISTFEFID